jgi:tRNA threonylcarbamoyladenosine biosynthesis protein TsaB
MSKSWRNSATNLSEGNLLLAIDTSTQWIGLALYDGTQVAAEMLWLARGRHTVEMAPAIQELLRRSAVEPRQLGALAVALGPGSFTSLRIGLALVKGMALALHLPVVSLPTLDILAAGQPIQDYPMAAILQAGRGRLAVGWYRANGNTWESQGKAEVVTIQQLSTRIHHPTLVCGELNADERQLLARKRRNVLLASPAQCTRRPGVLAELAWKRWQEGHIEDPVALSPIYLHVAEEIPQ